MGKERNKYPENVIGKFYKKTTLDIMIFTFIDTYKFLIPSAKINEIADAFVKRYKIAPDDLSREAILTSYYRTQEAFNEASKTINKIP